MADSDENSRSSFVRVLRGIGVVFVCVLLLLPLLSWGSLPGRIPAHFNFFGEVDGWGGKGMVFLLPVIGLALFGILTMVAGSPVSNYPFAITEENAERQYAIGRAFGAMISVWIVAGLTYIEWMMIRIARGDATGLGVEFGVIFLGGIVIITAGYLVRAFRAR